MIRLKISELFLIRTQILLVKQCDHFLIRHSKLAQGIVDHLHMLVHLRIGRIYHMEDHIRVFCFLQRAFKRLDQMMRQFPDKSYGICQKNLLFSRKIQCPCGWIQRGKQLVFLKNPACVIVFSNVDLPALVYPTIAATFT